MPSGPNKAILAAAGARKTQSIIDCALADPAQRVLITTYTNENLRQIESRIQQQAGIIPPNIRTSGWFSFLLAHGIRPYQRSVLDKPGIVGGLNFIGERQPYSKTSEPRYYIDRRGDVYRDSAAHLVDRIDEASRGQVVERLEHIFDHIYIDEIQDMVGYDLEVLDRLFRSTISVTVAGDLRQYTYATNTSSKNKKYRGEGLQKWFDERSDACAQEHRNESYRCHKQICAFASDLFPEFAPVTSAHDTDTGHDGIHRITPIDALAYYNKHKPQVLRWDKRTQTFGLPAINIGVSKGNTYQRVMIIPTQPMKRYLDGGSLDEFKSREKLYVAVTRAQHSVAFVL